MSSEARGPTGYANWRASEMLPALERYEVALYSDIGFTGEERDCGPYALLNLIADAHDGSARPAIHLRVALHLEEFPRPMEKTDYGTYHGAGFWEEIASLWSLVLGCRLKASGVVRDLMYDGDPYGRPFAELLNGQTPFLSVRRRHAILPRLFGSRLINDGTELIRTYPHLSAKDAGLLVRAARYYQSAAWIAETEPSVAWLLLVSAVDSVSKPYGGGSSKRFQAFLQEFLPDPPSERPELGRVDWTTDWIEKAAESIYAHRSRAVHDGIPFPWPMTEAPRVADDSGVATEGFLGLAAGAEGASWLAKDLPMTLHTFEYLVRNSLLKWWRSNPNLRSDSA